MAGVFHCPPTPLVGVTMRGDQEVEGFQITERRKEERERVKTYLGLREVEEGKLLLFPFRPASQSSPLLQLVCLHPRQLARWGQTRSWALVL